MVGEDGEVSLELEVAGRCKDGERGDESYATRLSCARLGRGWKSVEVGRGVGSRILWRRKGFHQRGKGRVLAFGEEARGGGFAGAFPMCLTNSYLRGTRWRVG